MDLWAVIPINPFFLIPRLAVPGLPDSLPYHDDLFDEQEKQIVSDIIQKLNGESSFN